MEWVLIAGAVAVLLWILSRRRARPAEAVSTEPATAIIDLKVLAVPTDIEGAIVAAIREGRDPDEIELPATLHAHDLRVAGESFANANGESRQNIIDAARVGDPVYLVPEPDNPYDSDAVRVYTPGSPSAKQIGYLPRGYLDIVDEIRDGKVAAWLKAKRRADNGLWGATLYLVRSNSL